ncbi:hypothetical protein N9023_02805 [Opitutaceae bacterium]|nr:hypothetical protein [Opitutaceae bacterium]
MTTPPTFPAEFPKVRGGDSGFRIARHTSGQWWWIDPSDQARVVCGVHGLDANVGPLPADVQVEQWGINLLLPPVADGFCGTGLPYMHDLQVSRGGAPVIREEGVTLPDVFDPVWAEVIEQVFNAYQATPVLAGWTADSELSWGGGYERSEELPPNRPGLLQVCLGLDPAYRAYHAAWEFVLARHGDDLAQLEEAWGVKLPSRGAVRQYTREEVVFNSPAHHRDLEAFTSEFATRYFVTVRDAATKVNPSCLLFSPRIDGQTPAQVATVAGAAMDVVVVAQTGLVAAEVPQLLIDYNWAETEWPADAAQGESALEATIRGGREALTTLLQRPEIIGYAWAQYRGGDLVLDHPLSAGLVDENGRENPVHAFPLAAINAAAGSIRSSSL